MRLSALIALKPVSHSEQRAEDDGAIIAGQVHDPGFHDEAAEFDETARALAALDLPRATCYVVPLRLDADCAPPGCAGVPSVLRSVVGAFRRGRLRKNAAPRLAHASFFAVSFVSASTISAPASSSALSASAPRGDDQFAKLVHLADFEFFGFVS